jgi:hypothetical protein
MANTGASLLVEPMVKIRYLVLFLPNYIQNLCFMQLTANVTKRTVAVAAVTQVKTITFLLSSIFDSVVYTDMLCEYT